MTTPFLRLLKSEDKESALASSISSIRSGHSDSDTVFHRDSCDFTNIPNRPFAYWANSGILNSFSKAALKDIAIIEMGMSTKDDSRFVRLFWEVDPKKLGYSNTWSFYIKGSDSSELGITIATVVKIRDGFRELEQAIIGKYPYLKGNAGWVLHPEYHYGVGGLTYGRRSRRFKIDALPAGCVFSENNPAIFPLDNNAKCWIGGLLNEDFCQSLLALLAPPRNWDTGYVGSIPIAIPNERLVKKLKEVFLQKCNRTRMQSSCDEISPLYSIIENIGEVSCSTIPFDDIARLYGCSENDFRLLTSGIDEYTGLSSTPDDDSQEDTTKDEAAASMSRVVGCSFGRFDSRIFLEPALVPALPDPFDPLPVCPPAILVGTDGLPAQADNIASEAWLRARPNASTLPPEPARSQKITAADYPLDIPWDGILVDDPDDSRDILGRLRAALRYLHSDKAEEKERELCTELGMTDLRDYLRKPSLFFDAHLKRYSKSRRKAPIYWPLQTRDGRYTIWIYYPRLSADTLYACSNILEDKLKLERRKLEMARDDLVKSESKSDRLIVEELADFTTALAEMKEEIDRVAGLPFKPDLDDGVQITASPLWRLFRHPAWQKELKATWEKLEEGDYDWAHLAYSIWPDRVREKCKKDRSLAIAHELEDICEQKAPEAKAVGKKRGRKANPIAESDLDFEEDE